MECFSFYVPSVAGLTHELDCSPALSLNLQSGLVHYPVSYTTLKSKICLNYTT